MAEVSIAKKVKHFVLERPFVRESLKRGLVNFSALARTIIKEEKLSKQDFDAVVVALRRLFENSFASKDFEEKIIGLLRKSRVEVKNSISVVVLENKILLSQLAKILNQAVEDDETFHLIHGTRTFTIITTSNVAKKISETFSQNVVSRKDGLVEVVVRTSKDIEKIPGVVAYMYSRFSEKGVNILETLSSWTETLFVVEEKDALLAMQAVKFD